MTKYEDQLATQLGEQGVSVEQIRRRRSAALGNTVCSWVTRYRPGDAAVVHATFQTVAPAAFLHRPSSFVVTVHDLAPLVYPSELTDISTTIQWRLTPAALGRADRIIAISEFTKAEILRLTDVDPERIRVVPQGIDHDRYRVMDRDECKEYFGLGDGPHVLVVSSNVEHKRTEDALPILNAVQSTYPDAKLLKAGYGTDLDGEDVISTGWIPEDDMPMLYNAADVYLHTSEYEGFGLPILEAMACGTPIVARNVASIPEIVGEVYELAPAEATVRRMADDVCERLDTDLSDAAVERSERFSWERTARATRSVYEEVSE